MWDWLLIAVLYVLVLVFFRLLGGVDSAGDALRRWGRASSRVDMTPGSSH